MRINYQKQSIWLSVLIVLSFLLFGFYVISSVYKIKHTNHLSEISQEAFFYLSQLQTSKSEFLLNASSDSSFITKGTNSQLETYDKNLRLVISSTNLLKDELRQINPATVLLVDSLKGILKEYSILFLETTGLIKEKGFKNDGLEGKMRKAIHNIENSSLITDKTHILTLRRHEKDFLLRKDFQYVKKFDSDFAKFSAIIEALPESASTEKIELLKQLEIYKSAFYKIINNEKQIGLSSNDGNKFLLKNTYDKAYSYLRRINKQIVEESDNVSTQIIRTFIFLFLAIAVSITFALYWLHVSISTPITEMRKSVERISNGDLSINLNQIKSSRLLKSLIIGFDNIILKFRDVMNQIEDISTRKITEALPAVNENDEITKTLNNIIVQLKVIDEAEKRRLWHSEGLSKFADMLRDNHNNYTDVYDNVLKNFVKQLGANQAALFVLEEGENEQPMLELKACYAFNRKKYINKKIAIGEGLAGVAFAEKHTIFLTDVPDEYVKIKSGLGFSNPNCILIVPLLNNEQVVGVLELASFKVLEQYEIDFTKSVSESLASFILNTKVSERTHDLLEKSKLMTQQLRNQEDELKQNMEDMLAAQEEMRRHERELEMRLEKMSTENVQLRNKKATARKGEDDFIRDVSGENKWSPNNKPR